MILDDKEIEERIESPLNLLNRLKEATSNKRLPVRIPTIPPKADELVDDLEDKVQEALARKRATNIMNKAMNLLDSRIEDVQKPETLARIAGDMGRIVAAQNQNKENKGHTSQIIVYAPQMQTIDAFEVIDVKE